MTKEQTICPTVFQAAQTAIVENGCLKLKCGTITEILFLVRIDITGF